mmetsp:Transcript_10482/g.18328  ORF Transcript_10482/g.18328 Transcript_10482/m.18328 type:complete len:524 (-) Transcript_10482:635-2206(-)
MVRAPAPTTLLKFQGRRDWPPEPEVDDWGLTPSQQESYVEQFRRILSSKDAWQEDKHDYYALRRFLRARTYDLEKATIMWMNNMAFKAEFKVDTMLQDFYFGEREKFIEAFPQGYHKCDKKGRPIYIQLLGQVDVVKMKKVTTEERMIKFHIQEYERCNKVIMPVCSHLAGRNVDQTFGILDAKGVGLSHLSGEVKRVLTSLLKYDQDNYPEALGHICIINAPSVFRMLWNLIKGVLDARTQSKIEILGTNYLDGLLKWVDIDSIPVWLGGKSHGSLIDDIGPWSDPEVLAQLGMDLEDLRHNKRPPPSVGGSQAHMSTTNSLRDHSLLRRVSDASEGAGGFHSPSGSSADLSSALSHRPPSQRLTSASSPEMIEDANSRHISLAAVALRGTTSNAPSIGDSGHMPSAPGGFTAIPEAPALPPKASTLTQRVATLEAMFPPHIDRLKPLLQESATIGLPMHSGASNKSAPPGSLVYRVEVLEEALDTLVVAQKISLANQQQLLTQAKEREKGPKPRQCCCCIC